jgi:serine/threonine protein kinase
MSVVPAAGCSIHTEDGKYKLRHKYLTVSLMMMFLDRGTLHSMLSEVERLSDKTAKFYIREISLEVKFLHSCGSAPGSRF